MPSSEHIINVQMNQMNERHSHLDKIVHQQHNSPHVTWLQTPTVASRETLGLSESLMWQENEPGSVFWGQKKVNEAKLAAL